MTESKRYKSEGLTYPYNTPDFINAWAIWLEHRKELKKPIKGKISQQAALKKLGSLSNGSEETAIAVINQSLENNWRGLFALQTTNRNAGTTKETNNDLTEALKRRYAN